MFAAAQSILRHPCAAPAFAVAAMAGLAAHAATLTHAFSRKAHGTNVHQIAVDLTQSIGGALTVESRAIGTGHQIVFWFDAPVTTFGTPSATDASGVPVGSASAQAGTNDSVVVTLTGVPDNKRVRLALPAVNGMADAVVALGFLVGDANNSRTVSAADLTVLKSNAGSRVDASNARFDFNASGMVTAADIAAVKSRAPRALPEVNVQGGGLNVAKSGTGTGTVTSNPPGIQCGADCTAAFSPATVVTLTATSSAGSAFTRWGGACAGTSTNVCTVTMNAAKSVTATFMGSEFIQADSNPLRLTVVSDAARAVTQAIPLSGGMVSATGADGTVYTLDIPADALSEPTEISMTPVASLATPGLSTEAAYGVELGPAGASFHNFVTLSITPPPGANVPITRQLPIGWSGTQNDVSLAVIDPTPSAVKLKLMHFSGYALLLATTGINATIEPLRHRLGGTAEARIESLIAERLAEERYKQQIGAYSDGVSVVNDLLREYDEQVVQPRVAAAGSSCAAGRLALQTVTTLERLKQSLGVDTGTLNATLLGVQLAATEACTREEYALCRDEHIITRILPHYQRVKHEAQRLGFAGDGTTPDPSWVQDAEAAVAKCLNFEMLVNSRLTFNGGASVDQHTVTESVESRVKLTFNLGLAMFGPGYVSISMGGGDPLVSTAYNVYYPHQCASVSDVQRIGATMMGSLGFTANEGGVAQRATVKDFFFTPAVVPNGAGSGYSRTLLRIKDSGCEGPANTTQQNENWVVFGFPTFAAPYNDPVLGLAIRNWRIVGGDIMATRDFNTQETTDFGDVATVTNMVLFHKPLP
ncbi:MAG: hypothetical protein JNK75_11140 [Betaproteobacteria bacterium]|nr:hypothetical protein [Betaproteobacteria bacterium]